MTAAPLVAEAAEAILQAVGVTKRIPLHGRDRGRAVHALNGVDLTLRRGQILALVGESGSGKSTLARLLALGDTPTDGEIRFAGKQVRPGRRADRRAHFGRVQMVLQDPFSSLNNLHRVRYILSRPLRNFGRTSPAEIEGRILELLERVNLTPATDFIDKFPHELSGGQRQRIAIARALAAEPVVLLGDEPVSMLDVSIRLDILNLLAELRDRDGLAMLYITHDIASARYFADEISVMYAGHIVESGPAEQVTQEPKHPYTKLLLAASPNPDRLTVGTEAEDVDVDVDEKDLAEPPNLLAEPVGCPFAHRCPDAAPVCSATAPPTHSFAAGQLARCWLYDS
ncbi:ABC transporter ATP-binding protein [Micromonospora sp. CB01531]|uniref:ABC transporter ATP-binding protein n=1 Tax=Micromonospora sp. CB01531 TaxID=1718947 RepID=UPI00093F2F37|nr:ABC transporter ATP-binding protein [Micromonospora sp. CB01531]OKI54845.1 dipeptide/oligopeptide/nickel ABC transporter ATP-binding protein [Micromonospora sp. CB01531]